MWYLDVLYCRREKEEKIFQKRKEWKNYISLNRDHEDQEYSNNHNKKKEIKKKKEKSIKCILVDTIK